MRLSSFLCSCLTRFSVPFSVSSSDSSACSAFSSWPDWEDSNRSVERSRNSLCSVCSYSVSSCSLSRVEARGEESSGEAETDAFVGEESDGSRRLDSEDAEEWGGDAVLSASFCSDRVSRLAFDGDAESALPAESSEWLSASLLLEGEEADGGELAAVFASSSSCASSSPVARLRPK